jgi:uncharacterized protein YdgA (DUF945 family)
MLFLAGVVVGAAAVGAAWYYWPKIESAVKSAADKL